MAIGKNDAAAREHWGVAYDQIPKSVFAVLAWRLADRLGAYPEGICIEELRALGNQIIDLKQADRAIKAIREGASS